MELISPTGGENVFFAFEQIQGGFYFNRNEVNLPMMLLVIWLLLVPGNF
jgi:hypothetical protein